MFTFPAKPAPPATINAPEVDEFETVVARIVAELADKVPPTNKLLEILAPPDNCKDPD